MSHPTPSAIRQLSGSNLHRLNKKESKFRKVTAVYCPKHIERDKYAKEEWDRVLPELVDNGLLTRANLMFFSAYCAEFAKWMHAEDKVYEEGSYIEEPIINKQGEVVATKTKLHPAERQGREARDRMLRNAVEFGMTPASATRVAADRQEEQEKSFDSLDEDDSDDNVVTN